VFALKGRAWRISISGLVASRGALGGRRCALSILLSVAAFASDTAFSQSLFLPYGSTQYEYNDNVFALPDSAAAYLANGDPRLGDSDLKTIVGAEEDYVWDRQRFFATAEGRYIDYDHFGYLSHYEYLVKLDLDWKLFSMFDGTLLGTLERLMAPFANRNTVTQLELDLDRNAIAKINLSIAPEWRVETSLDYHNLDAPIEDYPDYGLTETTEHIALKYLGFSKFTYGLSADYLDGRYRNSPIDGTYRQTVLNLTATYAATGLSSFNGAIGHTERAQGENQGSVSAVTGEVGYTRKLSGKTSINVDYLRAVNSYIAAGGSEVDSTATVTINYQPTFITGFALTAQHTQADFAGQTIADSGALGRKDEISGASVKMNYQVLRWLLIQPYVTYQRRSSNEDFFNYTDRIIGIQVLAKKPAPPGMLR
jgi:hypothetical protein